MDAARRRPVAPLGALVGDVRTGTFGSATLEESDFQAAADATAAVTLTDEGGGVYSGLLDATLRISLE